MQARNGRLARGSADVRFGPKAAISVASDSAVRTFGGRDYDNGCPALESNHVEERPHLAEPTHALNRKARCRYGPHRPGKWHLRSGS
jgi:hypothetical protein